MSSYNRIITLLLLVLAAVLLTACGGDGNGAYTVISPVVNPGDSITGGDFIMVSAFADAAYTATLDTPALTNEPGLHEIRVTVSDGKGFERTHLCSYTVRSYLRDSVRVEAGEPLSVSKFINTEITNYSSSSFRFEDELAVAALPLGTHRVGIYVDETLYYSSLIIEDTVPPTATPVTVHIKDKTDTPRASDFVTNVVDATTVAFTFKEDYDFNTTDDIYVIVILTDEAGNTTEITSYATCTVDTTPPVLSGVHDITVYVGGSVSYMDGVTATDDSGEKPKITVDNKRVNLNEVGMYEITYTATDSAGNTTIERATVNVIEKPKVAEADMKALAKKIYNEEILTSADMTKWDIAYAIYKWTHEKITYTNDKVDKNDPIGAAYDGMKKLKGDCFTYMAVARELLEIAKIDCRQITRLQHEGEAAHYWLLVDIGDGWYHFDSCWHLKGKSFESFMRTDEELLDYCTKNDIEYYYRFDHSKYPARGTVSYYDTADGSAE